ncbi:hypothetical protein DFS33DRAFT_1402135 [Desarmillaria ectypa]|nr:hypothetical protein DFS33DRAFT_1402135 [Desarmillaria ectypa]
MTRSEKSSRPVTAQLTVKDVSDENNEQGKTPLLELDLRYASRDELARHARTTPAAPSNARAFNDSSENGFRRAFAAISCRYRAVEPRRLYPSLGASISLGRLRSCNTITLAQLSFQEIRPVVDKNIYNAAAVYTASIGVGSPATNYNLIIDTGSSNTCVCTGKTMLGRPAASRLGISFSGRILGTEYIDQVTITPELVVKEHCQLVQLSFLSGMGLPDNLQNRTNVLIASVIIMIVFLGSDNGELSWGGIDDSKITSNIGHAYAPHPTGSLALMLTCSAISPVTKAPRPVLTGVLTCPLPMGTQLSSCHQPLVSPTPVSDELASNAQIWSRSLNAVIKADDNGIYLIINNIGSNAPQGLEFHHQLYFPGVILHHV